MIFWLCSGLDQKSGDEICCSSLAIFDLWPGASKIPPHGQGLLTQGQVLSFDVFGSHISPQF
jgi:hypothetical protein